MTDNRYDRQVQLTDNREWEIITNDREYRMSDNGK